MTRSRFEREKAELERRIAALGFTLRWVDYCEDARTPGFLGHIRGVTDWELKEIRVATKAPDNQTRAGKLWVLAHELHHAEDPTWDCGARDVLGRGHPLTHA